MLTFRRFLFALFAIATAALSGAMLAAMTVEIRNFHGGVKAQIVFAERIQLRNSSPDRAARKDDAVLSREGEQVRIEARPADGARVDLEVEVPFGLPVRIQTGNGPIELRGMPALAEIATRSGDLRIEVPWEATRLYFFSEQRPRTIDAPKRLNFTEKQGQDAEGRKRWLLRDGNPNQRVTYGHVRVRAAAPGRVALRDLPIPEEAPVRLPWQAPAVLEALLEHGPHGRPHRRPSGGEPSGASLEAANGAEQALFSSEVRLVNLTVTVYDEQGRPLTGLEPEDFQILEEGVPQEVAFAGAEEAPFNLAILLDMSVSTKDMRPAIQEAARRFIGVARPHDRVALYALAGDMFRVIAPLSGDHKKLLRVIGELPAVSGATPLYDAVVHGLAYELASHPDERNALIVLSDGLDNQLFGAGVPSEVSFGKLRQAAAELGVLIYPVFLNPKDRLGNGVARRARARLEELAEASGGKLFRADSARDLEPVYPQVARELRAVYSLGYHPANQDFQGEWRAVEVRVERPGAQVRSRDGYRAW